MGTKRWSVPATAREQALRLVEVERALWQHRLAEPGEAMCALATLEQELHRGVLAAARQERRLLRLVHALERRLPTSSFGTRRWRALSQALGRHVVDLDRAASFRIGEAADRAIAALASPSGSCRAMIESARDRHRALRQDLIAALMPAAVHAASLQAVTTGTKIELLVNVAVASLCRAVDTIDPQLAPDYEQAVLRTVERSLRRHLEAAPLSRTPLDPAASEGF